MCVFFILFFSFLGGGGEGGGREGVGAGVGGAVFIKYTNNSIKRFNRI